MSTSFSNPWKELSKDALLKTTVDVSRDLISDIVRVHSKQGVLQTTIYLLLTKLVDELKRNDLTEYDPAAYELGVAGCTITFHLPQRSAANVPAAGQQLDGTAKATSGNDGPGSNGLAQSNEGPAPASSVDESLSKPVDRGSKNKKSKRGKGPVESK